ncbi:MAG: protein translocase subunit SecD, partial [Alphaproteobacteria bacterium]|nr:protein translocase subunit SecD [Alphaproteobacteria bacterium]
MPLDFPRWKTVLVLFATIFLLLAAIPNFIPDSLLNRVPDWIPHERLHYGLDLSGGSHLLLEADVHDVAKQKLDKMQGDLSQALRRADPVIETGDIAEDNGTVSVMVRNVADVDRAREVAYKLTNPVGVTGQRDWTVEVRDTTRLVMTPTQAGLNDAINSTVESARNVVAKRIDPNGTSEVTVVRQGANRILVEVPGLQDPEHLKTLLGTTAKMDFKMVDDTPDAASMAAKGLTPPGDQLLPFPHGDQPVLAVQRQIAVSGDDLKSASAGTHPETGQPVVNFGFNAQGSVKFARI